LEIVIRAIPLLKDKKTIFEIVGPAEGEYKNKLLSLTDNLKMNKRIIFSKPIYELKKKIDKIDSCKIFVLPSKSEGMPQSLIEAMAREKVVLGSSISAVKDIIKDSENGFTFNLNNPKFLAAKINLILSNKNSIIKAKARESVVRFSWANIIRVIKTLF